MSKFKISVKPAWFIRKISKTKREILNKEALKAFNKTKLKENIYYLKYEFGGKFYCLSSQYIRNTNTIEIIYDFISENTSSKVITENDHKNMIKKTKIDYKQQAEKYFKQ